MRRRSAAVVTALAWALAATPATGGDRYVALGDSYSSGTGTREYVDAGCERSAHAFPSIVDRERLTTDLVFAACAGATTHDVLTSQVRSLTFGTRIVTITIGGNDAGFATVLTRCARPWPWTCWGDIERSRRFIRDELPARLDALYADIRRRAPAARVLVLGYPQLFDGRECNVAARISAGEQRSLNAAAALLRDVTRARAIGAGHMFVDAIPRFRGHAVCSESEWINGLSRPITESYHPNRAGHRNGYAALVRAVIG